MSKIIREVYELSPPSNYSTLNKEDTQLFGVELEIENIRFNAGEATSGLNMEVTTDGSLRNNGMEFLLLPTNVASMEETLKKFFTRTKINENNYSERCSIHVHVNCQEFTYEQVYSILLIYQVVERLLYAWIGHGREDNIFCVPWHQTQLPRDVLNEVALGKVKQWQKYSGLNILPLQEYGTIEFRHMHGHCNVDTIIAWVNMLKDLVEYGSHKTVSEIKQEVLCLNSNSLYNAFITSVFPRSFLTLFALPKYKEKLEAGVLDLKYLLLPENQKESKKTYKATDRIEAVLNELERVAPVNRFVVDWLAHPVAMQAGEPGQANVQRVRDQNILEQERIRLERLEQEIAIRQQGLNNIRRNRQ